MPKLMVNYLQTQSNSSEKMVTFYDNLLIIGKEFLPVPAIFCSTMLFYEIFPSRPKSLEFILFLANSFLCFFAWLMLLVTFASFLCQNNDIKLVSSNILTVIVFIQTVAITIYFLVKKDIDRDVTVPLLQKLQKKDD